MTEAAKHTPGPWRVCGGYTPAYAAVHSERCYIVFGMADASVHHEGLPIKPITAPDMDEQRANANLIAAAPDLLAACKALYATHKQGKGQCCSAADVAIDAIAKAEGRVP